MWPTIKRAKDLNYFSLCALNLFNTRVSQFELNYWNKWTFPWHSNFLRCTCICTIFNVLPTSLHKPCWVTQYCQMETWKHKWDIQLPICPFCLWWSASADLISYSEWQRCGPWMPPIVLTSATRPESITPSKPDKTAYCGGLPVKCDDSWIL